MNISAEAGQLGLKLLDKYSPAIAKVAGTASGAGAEAFAKIATQAISKGLNKLAEKAGKDAPGYGAGGVVGSLLNGNGMSLNQGLSIFQKFDANHDGQLTDQEIQKGLAGVDEEIKKLATQGRLNSNDMNQMVALHQTKRFGSEMLKNYTAVSRLDGDQNGVSARDITALADLDQNVRNISLNDWQTLVKPENSI